MLESTRPSRLMFNDLYVMNANGPDLHAIVTDQPRLFPPTRPRVKP